MRTERFLRGLGNERPCRRIVWQGLQELERRVLLSVTDTILHDFAGRPNDGSVPEAGLILVGDKLYGVTQNGGPNDDGSGGGPGLGHHGGTLFSVNTDGSGYQVLHDFGGTALGVADGYEPLANLTYFNGKLYGTTELGGPGADGTIFSINPDGSGYELIHAFGSTDPTHAFDEGADPEWAALVPLNGKLYGIATAGGRPAADGNGDGVLFSINGDGTDYTEVHVFDFGTNVGVYDHGFVTDGTKFYGVTASGGATNSGRIWSMNVDGSEFQILHDFDPTTDGHGTLGTLTLVGTTLWGTTADSGPNGGGTLFSMNTDGTNFTVQHAFSTSLTGPDGVFPHTDLLLVGDTLYGSTTTGGPGFAIGFSPAGEIFSINTDGTGFQSEYTFNAQAVGGTQDGTAPYGALASDGTTIYGVTGDGGTNSIGTIFSFVPGASSQGNTPLMTVTENGETAVTTGTLVNFGTGVKGGTALTEVFTVTNSGTGSLIVGTPTLPAGFVLTAPPGGTVAAGGSTTFTVTLPTTTQGLFGGNVTISNNSGGTTNDFVFTVEGRVNASGTGGGSGSADLTVTLAKATPARSVLVPGDVVSLPVTVKNAGTATASGTGPIVVQVRASADAVYDDTDTLLGQFTIPSLAKGKSLKKVVKFTVPATLGTEYFVAKVDTSDVVMESNETNNTAASAPATVALEFGRIPGRPAVSTLNITESDGTLVTFRMTGAGVGHVTPGANGTDVAITGSTAGTALTITTTMSSTPGDDGRFTLGNLTIGTPGSGRTSIGKVTAPTTDLEGNLTITGGLAIGAFGNALGGGTISIGGAAVKTGGTLSFGQVTDTTLTSAGGFKSLKVAQWVDTNAGTHPDVITAPFINSLASTGDFAAGFSLTAANGGNAKTPTLNSATIGGATSGAAWTVAGNIGTLLLTDAAATNGLAIMANSIAVLTVAGVLNDSQVTLSQGVNAKKPALGKFTAAQMVGSQIRTMGNIGTVQVGVLDHSVIFAGVQPSVTALPATPADFVTTVPANLPTIGSMTITGAGASAALIDSSIAAGTINVASMPTATTAVSDLDVSETFGFATLNGPVGKYTGPASVGNFVSGTDSLVS